MEKSARIRDTTLYEKASKDEYDRLFKVIVVGDSGTGKSQLISRYNNDEFSSSIQSTVIMEHTKKLLSSKRVCVHLWDMAGKDMFRSITTCYYKNAVGAVVVYDITKVRSFENAKQWMEHLYKTLGNESPTVILVGNKLDMRKQRSVTTEEGQQLAKKNNALFIETSAFDSTNVQKAFTLLIDNVTDKIARVERQRQIKLKGGLQNGSQSLKINTGQTKTRPIATVIQTQPKSKFSFQSSAQKCLEEAKQSCSNFSCCFE